MKFARSILLTSCIVFLIIGCRGDTDKPRVGDIARDFRLDTLNHTRFYLNQYRGKVVVLLFWATWCNVCKTEMMDLKTFSDIPGSENLVAAVCSDPENINDVKAIVQNLSIDYPVLLDENAEISLKYKVASLPTTILVDKAGTIGFAKEGYSPKIAKQLKNKVISLLASDGSTK